MTNMLPALRHALASHAIAVCMMLGCFCLAASPSIAGPPDPEKDSPATPEAVPSPQGKPADAAAPAEAKQNAPKKVNVVDVLDGYVEATGGKEAYAKVNSRSMTASYEVVGQGVTYDLTIIEERPNKRYTYMISTIKRDPVESATDGTRAWSKIGRIPAKMKDGLAKALAIRAGYFDREVDWRKLFTAAKFGGVVTIDGKKCYKLVMTPTIGFPETHYYDIETKLLTQKDEQFDESGETMTTKFGDYRKVGGLLVAHQKQIDYGGHQRVMTLTKIEHNTDIRPDQYEPPPYPDPRY